MHAQSAVNSGPAIQTVDRCVEARAAERPDAPAVASRDETLSYEMLNHRAEAVAARLRTGGVCASDIVGLVCPSSPAMVVGALGILKAGAAYLPLDPAGPPDRIATMLSDAGVRWVVATGDRLPPAGAWRGITIDRRGVGPDPEPAELGPRPASSVDGLAYVIFTSGSTGRPKGVLVTHRNLLNLVRWHQETFAITPADRAMQVTSFGFDAAVWEVWPYLAAGASVHLVEPDARSDPRALRDWLISHRITIGFAPTMMAERLIASDWPAETTLRTLLTGADTLRRYPPPGLPFDLINNYGPTECTVVATSGLVPATPDLNRPPTIGRPITNAQIHILDEKMTPVPIGAIGEIYIGGAGVARGYLGQPERTAERFVHDPFATGADARLYRTGDRGCRLPNGEIAFHGRVDDQVKVRGYRIEPGEIAFALNRHPAVRESAVIAREAGPDETRLVAYLVLLDGHRPAPAELRGFLEKSLPAFMVPAAFVIVPALPVTANGKVDREALPVPGAGNVLAEPESASQSVLERQVVALLADLLNVDTIGIHDSFFHLGGHSLLAAQVIARVGDRFDVELPLRTLFDHPTPSGLAIEIERLVLARIEGMSDEDVRATLAARAEEVGR